MSDGLIRTTLGHWLVESDQMLARLVTDAASFEHPENLKVLTLVAPFIPEGGVVVNAGASIGDHTVTYSQIVGVSGCVYAFEPQPESYAALVKNTARLRNVVTINAALGNHPDEAAVFSSSPTNVGASFLGTMAEYPQFPISTVRVTTLDTALAEVPHVDFIHLDAEGMEPQILEGAAKMLERDHPVLLVEVAPQWLTRYGSTRETFFAQMHQLGYPHLIQVQPNPVWCDVLALPVGTLWPHPVNLVQGREGDVLYAESVGA